MLGKRFAIVTFAQALGPWYEECVESHGLTGRLAGIRMLDGRFASVADVQDEKEHLLVDLANQAVVQDEADVVILAGAPLAGLADKVKDRIPVPVVDQMAAAVKQAEALVSLRVRKATAGTFRRPAPKPTIGLPAGVVEVFRRRLTGSRAVSRVAPSRLGRRHGPLIARPGKNHNGSILVGPHHADNFDLEEHSRHGV